MNEEFYKIRPLNSTRSIHLDTPSRTKFGVRTKEKKVNQKIVE
jgi:hypothetical protein